MLSEESQFDFLAMGELAFFLNQKELLLEVQTVFEWDCGAVLLVFLSNFCLVVLQAFIPF